MGMAWEKAVEDGDAPAYFRLARILRDRIIGGELRPGDRLDPEVELCERFNLSRMTVRRAIALLVEEGMLRRERGRGTFVVGPRTDGGVFLIPDFQEEMRNRGVSASVRLLKAVLVEAGKTPAARLGIEEGERAIYLERVLEGAGEPLAFDRKYLLYDPSLPLLEAELGQGTTADLFSRCPALMPVRAELSLSATVLGPREAEVLASRKGAPAFCMEQLVWTANDRRVAWGWMIYRGDRFVFRSLSRSR